MSKLNYICIVLVICLLGFLLVTNTIEPKKTELYDQLMDQFRTIFPSENRNSGGVQFYHYISEVIQPSYTDFLLYNQMYCGVSGSPIDPQRDNRSFDIVIEDLKGKLWVGTQYICCTPCVCDMIRYARVEPHEYQGNPIYVFSIPDPCQDPIKIPPSVESFQCDQKKTTNASKTTSGRVIVGLFYNPVPYDPNNPDHKQIKQQCDELCAERNSQDPNELQGGMGDIFVKLASIGNQTRLQNVYGEPLQSCRIENKSTNQGSWDSKGYCSEMDGGVHQICMNVDSDTSDFSTQTGQSDWSESRVGYNHCMCLGAWALYKSKGLGTGSELQCDSIPDTALSKEYIKKWNTWNGNELPDQIVQGVDSLVEQCYDKKPSAYLRDKYDRLRESYPSEWTSRI